MQKFKETGDSGYIYQNVLDKACFQQDMAYGDFKNLPRRTASDKVLRDKHLILLKAQKMMDFNTDLRQCFINFFIKSLLVVPLNLHDQRSQLREINLLLCPTKNQMEYYTNQFLVNLKNVRYTHLIIKLIKYFVSYDTSFIFIVNMYGLFL